VDPELHGVQLIAPAPFEYKNLWRTGPGFHRGTGYQDLKQSLASRLIRRAEEFLPGLSGRIDYMDVATPITYHRYTLNAQGAALGWKDFHLWKQRTPFLKGLYQAGAWVGGASVAGAIGSGRTAAELILRDL